MNSIRSLSILRRGRQLVACGILNSDTNRKTIIINIRITRTTRRSTWGFYFLRFSKYIFIRGFVMEPHRFPCASVLNPNVGKCRENENVSGVGGQLREGKENVSIRNVSCRFSSFVGRTSCKVFSCHAQWTSGFSSRSNARIAAYNYAAREILFYYYYY